MTMLHEFGAMKRTVMLFAVILAAGLLAACGGDGDTGQVGSPSPTAETPANGDDGDDTDGGAAAQLELVAEGNSFNQDQLEASSGASVELTLQNNDSVPHNFSLYESEAAEENIFAGETFSGPDASRTYEFEAPDDAGTYFFRCDVHPTTMTGDFVVT
ncbi:MAG TPA: cupredoxin domain-containing protein [Actinomycetota bacterium]|nr:cupredoxin domain-containing protein [Actinomycetota bacterium]